MVASSHKHAGRCKHTSTKFVIQACRHFMVQAHRHFVAQAGTSGHKVHVSTEISAKHMTPKMSSFTHQVVRVMPAGGNGGRYSHTEGATGQRGLISKESQM